jgi:protein-S-isoprenylcysteine O-methyltransferase Ste14
MSSELNGNILGIVSFLLLAGWRVYWSISEQKTEREKPKDKLPLFHKKRLAQAFSYTAFGIIGVQLLGVKLFEMPEKSLTLQLVGFLLVIAGLAIAVKGRIDLGNNWANCFEYQVKKKQEVVTRGIYKVIRHPIYAGIVLFFIGGELVVQSYLLYFYLFTFVAVNIQAKREEVLLVAHFGNNYRRYMKRTKRFIPYLW